MLRAPPGATATPARPATPQAARPATRPTGQRPPVQAAPAVPAKRPRAAAAGAAGAAAAAAAAAAASAATPTPSPAEIQQPQTGTATGLPIPRFVSLRSDEVNLRIGPDTRFPIEWTYQRRDLPVEIVREYNQWRRIRDVDGTEGWVHQSTLAGRRTFMVQGAERDLRSGESETSGTVAKLMPSVVGRIRRCEAASAWCEVQVGDHRGYLRRGDIWGVVTGEAVN